LRPSRQGPREAQRRDQAHPPTHKIGGKCGQSIISAIGQALLDHDVTTDDEARLGQALTERNDPFPAHRS
jgi:hypothetical protein